MAICLSNSLWAQVCTPDSTMKIPGYKPDSLQIATVGVAYKQTLTVQSFKDTVTVVFSQKVPVSIDSILVTAVSGMPSGFNYACLTSNCRFLPLINSCVELSGTPSKAGIYPLSIKVTAYAKINGTISTTQKDSVKKFRLIVADKNSQVKKIAATEKLLVYPIPAQNTIQVFAENSKATDILLLNTLGQMLSIKPNMAREGVYEYDLSNLQSGVYFVNCKNTRVKFIKK